MCPCTLVSDNGISAEATFGLKNDLDVLVYDLSATIAIVGSVPDGDSTRPRTAFVDTISLDSPLEPSSELDSSTHTFDLGVIPAGNFYFELIIHVGSGINQSTIRDSVWFEDEVATPPETLNLSNMNLLIDTDSDGVNDFNEELEATDPNDPEDYPAAPVIDVLLLYTPDAMDFYNAEPNFQLAHTLAETEFLFETSGSPVEFRTVGLLDSNDVPQLTSEETNSRRTKRNLAAEISTRHHGSLPWRS